MESSMNGTITSPNYPCEYPNNVQCTWVLSADDGNCTLKQI